MKGSFISNLEKKDIDELKDRLANTFPFFYYPASELTLNRPDIDGQKANYIVVRSRTQGGYDVTDFDCRVLNGSSEVASSIMKTVKEFMIEKFPDDYPYFYNKNLTKKLEEEKIK